MSEDSATGPLTATRREFTSATAALVATLGVGVEDAQAQIESQFGADAEERVGRVYTVVGLEDERDQVQTDLGGGDYYNVLFEAVDTGNRYLSLNGNEFEPIMTIPKTQVDEVRTENFQSFFNHTFARPGAPDSKNWDFTPGDVTKDNSEVELASTTVLQSNQRGNYPPGSEAIPGVAFRVTGTPTAGRADAGYFTDDNGVGAGEDATDSCVFLRKGGTEKRVYRADWNGYVPDGRLWVNGRPVITRMPHLFYGGGDIEIRALIHGDTGSTLRTLHTFTPDNVDDTFTDGPPINQPNLPIRFESSSLSGGALRGNASHYEFGEVAAETRTNGEHFVSVDAGTTGWTPLMLWQKRDGWEMVNVEPLKLTVAAAGSPAKLELQLNPTLSNVTTQLPTNTSSDETAVEIVDGTVDAYGERRWPGYVPAGQGSKSDTVVADSLTFNLPATQTVGLFAQGVGGTSTLSGCVGWEEFF